MATVLVTDDEPSDRTLIHIVLEKAGHRLLFAADGEKALERYDRGDIDVVVTDLVMPNLNGFLLIQELKERDPDARIVALSGKSIQHLERATEYGAVATITKPVDPEELLEAVREAARGASPSGPGSEPTTEPAPEEPPLAPRASGDPSSDPDSTDGIRSFREEVDKALRNVSLLSNLPDDKLREIVEIVEDFTAERAAAALREVELFEDLAEADLTAIQDAAVPVSVNEGEVLFEEGEPGDTFYVVLAGAIDVLKGRGSEQRRLAIMRSGDTFGEMALLNSNPRSATARAAEPTHLLAISQSDFEELLGGETLAVRMLRGLSKRLWATSVRFAAETRPATDETTVGETPKKVLGELSRLIQRRMIPDEPPRVEGYTLAADANLREHGRGGTVWDAFPLGDGRMVLAVISVLGEGLPPAHHLAVVRALFREIGRDHQDLGTLLRRTNNALADTRIDGLKQTVESGLIALQDAGLEWASAGRAQGFVVRSSGEVHRLPSTNAAMGVRHGFEYETHEVRLAPDDSVLLFADVPEDAVLSSDDLVPLLRNPDPARAVSEVLDIFSGVGVGRSKLCETTSVLIRRAPDEADVKGPATADAEEKASARERESTSDTA